MHLHPEHQLDQLAQVANKKQLHTILAVVALPWMVSGDAREFFTELFSLAFIAAGQDDTFNASPDRSEDFFSNSTDRKNDTPQRDFSGHSNIDRN